jgi:hypothetical protein
MAGWGKASDASQVGDDNFSANNTPYRFMANTDPFNSGATTKRNIIITNLGYVRRYNYTDVHSNARTKDETLISIGGLDTTTGFPSINEIYISNVSSNTANLYVVFSEPVYFKGSANGLTIFLANTISGNSHVATANASIRDVINANNTVVFKIVGSKPGTYFINANTIAVTAGGSNLISLNSGAENANLTISGAVSNAFGTFTL